MSYTELIPFIDGKPIPGIEFRNAWGGSARIWSSLFDAHVIKQHQYDSWLSNNGNDQRLWDIAKREDVPLFARTVHAFTFDRFYVRRDNFEAFACALDSFVKHYPVVGKVDHLPKWREYFSNADCDAVGVYGTSVSENPWYRQKDCPHCGQSTDETEPVPLSEGTEVYEWIESLTTQTQAEGKG